MWRWGRPASSCVLDVYRALDYLRICRRETQKYEADDEIAAYVHAWGKETGGMGNLQ